MYAAKCKSTRCDLTKGQKEANPDLLCKMVEVRNARDKVRRAVVFMDSDRCSSETLENDDSKVEEFNALDAEYVRLHMELCDAHRLATYVHAKAASYQHADGMKALAKAALIDDAVEKSLQRALTQHKRSNALKSNALD